MTRETLLTLAVLLAVFGSQARADTVGPADPSPFMIAPDCENPRDIWGIMQPPAKQYVSGPILLDMEPPTAPPIYIKPVQPVSPIPVPATLALLAPVLAGGLWLATRRKAK